MDSSSKPVDWEFQWGQIVARSWTDKDFKKRLMTDPAGVLKEYGVIVPSAVKINVLENNDQTVNFVIPNKPPSAELSEDELHRASGGWGHRCGCFPLACARCLGCARCYGCDRCCGCDRC
jgi:hypothetical protein